jgi:hypothetical protein
MKSITLREACHILNRSKKVEIGGCVASFNQVDCKKKDFEVFLDLNWSDDGFPFNAKFLVKDNKYVDFDGKSLYFISSYGDREILKLV